ncbi:MAG: hypothetical protein AAF518_25760, partial [Spirochaetota bacterium]
MLQLYSESNHTSVEDFLQNQIPQALLERIRKDSNLWVSKKVETQILTNLQEVTNLKALFEKAGDEIFHTKMFELLPDDGSQVSCLESLLKIPIIFSLYDRTIFLKPEILSTTSIQYTFFSSLDSPLLFTDILFLYGILCGAVSIFDLANEHLQLWIGEKGEKRAIQEFDSQVIITGQTKMG